VKELFYSIDAAIFEKFPEFRRGVVLAGNVSNGESPNELIALLRAEEMALRQRLTTDTLTETPHIKAWREAFRSLGIKPSEYRPSIEAMARRVLRNEPLPSINTLVDIGNVLSLRFLVPVGGHSMDDLKQDIALRFADGNEDFTPFGSDVLEHPATGEIIFAEGNIVLTRRWVWRQSNHTLTLPETRSIEVNIDALPPLSVRDVERICEETMHMIYKYCGGKTRYEILDAEHPKMSLRIDK